MRQKKRLSGRFSAWSVLALTLLSLFAAGCSVTQKVRGMFGGELPFSVSIASDANESSAIAVDLIVVYDDKVLEQLMKMPAAEWFKSKKQLRQDYANELLIREWEWIPSQTVEPQTIEYRPGARKVVLFADYGTQGDHRAAIDPQQPFHLNLDTLEMQVKVGQ